ncbi:GNAT family N-acetyltransferase [Brevibacterium marinum]|uniref:Putative acetyltransferase n=1 Tax=Brevibacterium marinum TaxID=418643 RepID=A0A846RP31_9MICO|nr:N-acetyltransferase [Brevibacterium marinum]NJC55664.1 putative acetyltransferase [Brevibacterium marinum]
MLIRRERSGDTEAIRAVTAAAFRAAEHSAPPAEPGGDPGEATLISWLRSDPGWIPELSLVALDSDEIIGHVVATRAHVGSCPALGLGPISVLPERQGAGVGSALMHAVLGAADARGETVVGLLGDPAYYGRFGFVPASTTAVTSPDPAWGDYFQVRTLSDYEDQGGPFQYASPFDRF